MVSCGACGSENPAGFRFCGACGAVLGDTAGEVRKTVTVLFCDMVGSTALGERTDPEVLREIMRRYHATCREILERHGGTVEKFVGDAAMAVFGIPRVHEDDPLRAVRAAVELRDAVAVGGVQTRIGVNTGAVVTGRGETLVTGDAVNVAARLEQAARGGEILIGSLTAELCGDAVKTDPAEPLTLKGKRDPVAAYRVREITGASAFPRASTTPFVGRSRELAQLEASIVLASRGQPQLATIVGPPGIGKSRLVRELVARTNVRLLVGRCLSYGAGITYWPLREVAEQVGDVRTALGAAAEAELVATRIEAAIGPGGAAATPEEIAWGFRRLLEEVARTGPLVVVLDDIHWAEPTLLDLVEYIAAFARDVPLTLICTARPDLFERRPGWATPRANTLVVTLEPLAGADTASLVSELGHLDAQQRARIVDAAEGNPLFVEQLVAMQREHGDAALAIPPTLQALLAARIDGLSAPERAVLERGAIEGRLFHRGSVAELLPEPERAGVGAQLLTLVRKALVRPDQAILPGDDGYRFGHVLIRDAAYDAMPKRQRADLHERFADWLEWRLGDGAPAEIVGYHLEHAALYRAELGAPDPSLGTRAAEQLRRAAVAARTRGDVPATISLFSRAAEALAPEDPRRPELLLAQGDALHDHADYASARAVLEQALREARAASDTHNEWRARLAIANVRSYIEPEPYPAESIAEARAAIAFADGHGDHEVAVHAWHFIANNASYGGRQAEETEALGRALSHARAHGDRMLEVEVLRWHVPGILFGDIPVDDGLRRTEEIRALVEGVPAAQGFLDHMTGHLLARVGQHDEARRIVGEWRGHIRDLGQILMHASTAGCAWDVANLSGEWASGEAPLREAFALLESRGEKGLLCTVAAYLAQALLRQGRHDEAERFARMSAELGARDDVFNELLWRSVLAETLAARGAAGDEAVTLAREAVALADGSGFFEYRGGTRVALAAALGAGPESRRALDEAIDIYTRKGNRVMRERVEALRAGRPAAS